MIKSISSTNSSYLQVSSPTAYSGYNNGNQSAGMVRYNMASNNLEVYDGTIWHSITSHASVDLSQHTINILRWAEDTMKKDQEIQKMIQANPTVADAYNAYKDAADKLQVVVSLTKAA